MEEKKFKRHPCQQATYLSLSFILYLSFTSLAFPFLPFLHPNSPQVRPRNASFVQLTLQTPFPTMETSGRSAPWERKASTQASLKKQINLERMVKLCKNTHLKKKA